MSTEWKMVPVEPTEEMLRAGARAHVYWTGDERTMGSMGARQNCEEVHHAMLAAAPDAPGEPVDAPTQTMTEIPAERTDVIGYPERVWINKGDDRFPEDDVWTDEDGGLSGPAYVREDLVAPGLSAIRAEERRKTLEEAAMVAKAQADMIGRIMAAGWRGNPHMSGDDRNFMQGSTRRRHDDRAFAAAEHCAAAIRALATEGK